MTNLNRILKKKIIVLTSVFVALFVGLSTSALYLSRQHQQAVTAAIPTHRYTDNQIIQAKQPLDLHKAKEHNIDIRPLNTDGSSKPIVTTNSGYLYVMNGADTTVRQQTEAARYLRDISPDVSINHDIIFRVAGKQNAESNIPAVNQIDLQGRTLRQYADAQGKKLIAVIDTGVNGKNAVQSMNFSSSKTAADVNGHGTKVARQILKNADDKAIILSLKAIDDNGTGTMTNVIKAINYAMSQHVDIINMSITAIDDGNTNIFKSVVTDTLNQGIKVVAAAGNYGLNASNFIPSDIDGVIVAGSEDASGTVSDFSNYGIKHQVYVKNTSSTSMAAATVTGNLAAHNTATNGDNITESYRLSPKQVLQKPFEKNDKQRLQNPGETTMKIQDDEPSPSTASEVESTGVTVQLWPNEGSWEYEGNTHITPVTLTAIKNSGDHVDIGTAAAPERNITISYILNGGDMPASHPEESDTETYTFDRWQITSDGTTPVNDNDYGFFQIADGKQTNVYVAGGKDAVISARYHYAPIKLPLPERDGYQFDGWYEDEDFTHGAGKKDDSFSAPSDSQSDITLYAKWTQKVPQSDDVIDTKMVNLQDPNPQSYKFRLGVFDTNGNPLPNAQVQVTRENDSTVLLTADENGLYAENNLLADKKDGNGYYQYDYKTTAESPLPAGTYIAHESQTPQGYFTAPDYKFSVTSDQDITITLNDDKISTYLSFVKDIAGTSDGHVRGAQFWLFDTTVHKDLSEANWAALDDNQNLALATATTDENGKLIIDGDGSKSIADYLYAGHNMVLHEHLAENFQTLDFKFTVPAYKTGLADNLVAFDYDPETRLAHLKDRPVGITLEIKAVDGSDNQIVLENVTFQLCVMKNGKLYPAATNADGVLIDPIKNPEEYQHTRNILTETTGKDGIARFDNLAPKALSDGKTNEQPVPIPELGKTKDENGNLVDQTGKESDWYIRETQTSTSSSKHYQLLSAPIKLSLTDEQIQDALTNHTPIQITISNNGIINTVRAGGNGILSYMMIGSTLLGLGVCALVMSKKNKTLQH